MERALRQSPRADRGMLARMPETSVVARRVAAPALCRPRDYGFRGRCVTCAFAPPRSLLAPL